MDVSKVLEDLKAARSNIEAWIQRRESEPPLEAVGVGVRIPRPKPKLPPAAVALPVPPPENDSQATYAVSTAHR